MQPMLEEHLWDFANIIAGFAAAQGIAFSYALATEKARAYFREARGATRAVIFGKLLVAGAYLYAIWSCYVWATWRCYIWVPSTLEIPQEIWWETSIWRSVAVLYFGLLPVFVMHAADRLAKKEAQQQGANKKEAEQQKTAG